MNRLLHLCLCAALIAPCALTLTAQTARADVREGVMKRLEESDAVRRRKVMRDGRFEIALALGSTLGDTYNRALPIGLLGNMYLSDSFALGVNAFYGINLETGIIERIKASRGGRFAASSFSGVGFGASLEANFVPAFGKLSLLGVMNGVYDMGLIVGAGVIQVSGEEPFGQIAPAPVIGVGMRFFASDSFAISLQLRDYIYSRSQSAVKVTDPTTGAVSYSQQERWQNQFFLTLAFSFLTGKPRLQE
jgi:outer membrane beta-barrel protein